MEALKNKLKSRRGASILLAMLFLLVCVLVGASVVMAASSNVGKYTSNKTEQQNYLTVTSALQLLVEELENVEYWAQYEYDAGTTQITTTKADGLPDTRGGSPHTYTLVPGKLRVKNTTPEKIWELDQNATGGPVLPLHANLDKIVETAFTTASSTASSLSDTSSYTDEEGTRYEYTDTYDYKTYSIGTPELSYKLTFQVSGNYGGLTDEVVITVKPANNGSIKLEAELAGDPDYRMEALLTCTRDPNSLTVPSKYTYGDGELGPVGWKLDYMAKRVEDII